MKNTIKNKLLQWREHSVCKAIQRFLDSRYYIAVLTVVIMLAQLLGLDMVGFSVLGLLFIYGCLFGKDTTPLVPLLCMAVFCVSLQNSPWAPASGFQILEDGSYEVGAAAPLYTSLGFILFAAIGGSIIVAAAILRVWLFGLSQRLSKKNYIFWGLVLLCISFITSGWFSASLEWEDVFSALIQVASFFLVYLFFITTLDFEKFTLDYIANVMIGGMLCMTCAVVTVYLRRVQVFTDLDSTWKSMAVAGFGTSNSIGAYAAITLPACFYKMYRVHKSQKWIWSVMLLVGIGTILLSLCRSGMLALVLIVPSGIIAGIASKKTRVHMLITTLVYMFLLGLVCYGLYVTDSFRLILDYFVEKVSDGDLNTLTSGRIKIWTRQWGYFLRDPIFGGGFVADKEYWLTTQFVNPNSGMSMYSVNAHNIFFQALGGGGIVGLLALGAHLITVCKLMLKRRVQSCGFLTLAILSHLLISLLDTVFYTAQFTFLYLILLIALQADVDRMEVRISHKVEVAKARVEKGSKPRVLFPFVEAGFGHIMPMKSIADAFEAKYGNVCEVVRSKFYTETKQKPLITFEKNLTNEARKYAKHSSYGYLNMFAMNLFTPWILPTIIMDVYIPGCGKAARRHMRALRPDMVVSTHWSTPYYAHRLENKPINVCYAPDAQMIPFWKQPCDAVLMSKEPGYKKALQKNKRRFNKNNLFLVPFAIRGEALKMTQDKAFHRRALGLDENKITITLLEGGYGEGKMEMIIQQLLDEDLPLNVVAVCGKNDALRKELSAISCNGKMTLKVEGVCNPLEYFAASDIFIGKSGASTIAEATYFGCAAIISKYATTIERDNAEYYINHVGNAIKLFEPTAIVETLKAWCENDEQLRLLQEKAKTEHDNYGSEKTADLLFELLCERFPRLKND